MSEYTELKRLAKEQFAEQRNHTADTVVFRGIGYALLVLAEAIKKLSD